MDLKLSDLKHGDIYNPDYSGIILEIVEKIPMSAKCPSNRGRPGVLVYWRFSDTTKESLEEIYPHILPRLDVDLCESLSWIPLDKLQRESFPRLAAH